MGIHDMYIVLYTDNKLETSGDCSVELPLWTAVRSAESPRACPRCDGAREPLRWPGPALPCVWSYAV